MDDDVKSVLIPLVCVLILGIGVGVYTYYSFTHTSKKEEKEVTTTKYVQTNSTNFYQFGENQYELLVEEDTNEYLINGFKIVVDYSEELKNYDFKINYKTLYTGDKVSIVYIIDDVLLVRLNNKIALYNNQGDKLSEFTYSDPDFRITSLMENEGEFTINLSRVNGKNITINGQEYDLCSDTDFTSYAEMPTDIYVVGKISNNEFITQETYNVNKYIESYLSDNFCE